MQQLILVLAALAPVAIASAVLIPALMGRASTPEARAERDRALRDELGALR